MEASNINELFEKILVEHIAISELRDMYRKKLADFLKPEQAGDMDVAIIYSDNVYDIYSLKGREIGSNDITVAFLEGVKYARKKR
jgi:hypothetical protein